MYSGTAVNFGLNNGVMVTEPWIRSQFVHESGPVSIVCPGCCFG